MSKKMSFTFGWIYRGIIDAVLRLTLRNMLNICGALGVLGSSVGNDWSIRVGESVLQVLWIVVGIRADDRSIVVSSVVIRLSILERNAGSFGLFRVRGPRWDATCLISTQRRMFTNKIQPNHPINQSSLSLHDKLFPMVAVSSTTERPHPHLRYTLDPAANYTKNGLLYQ